MTVTCPECQSVFRVDPTKVPATGVRARCSVCGGIIAIAGGTLPVSVTPIATGAITAATRVVRTRTPTGPITPSITRVETPRPAYTVDQAMRATAAIRTPAITGTMATSSATPSQASVQTPSAIAGAPIETSAAGTARVTPAWASTAWSPTMPSRGDTPEPRAEVAPKAVTAPAGRSGPDVEEVARTAVGVASQSATLSISARQVSIATPVSGGRSAERRHLNPFLKADPAQRARRLARALVSDLVAYHPAKREEGLREGTLRQLFREEIKKSYEEYTEQVGREIAESAPYFQEALNDILAGGHRLF